MKRRLILNPDWLVVRLHDLRPVSRFWTRNAARAEAAEINHDAMFWWGSLKPHPYGPRGLAPFQAMHFDTWKRSWLKQNASVTDV